MKGHADMRLLPAPDTRVETGPVQFGDDWPGVFVRGDDAGSYALALKQLLAMPHDPQMAFVIAKIYELQSLLAGCVIGPAAKLLEVSVGSVGSISSGYARLS